MWQVWQAWGCRASCTEKVWRVWQASQEATPKPAPDFRSSAISASLFSPILWHPPHPFIPSIRATGWAWAVGIAFMAAQATACLPPLNCSNRSEWQPAQVSGVGIFALTTSVAEVWSSPWQTEQSTSFWLCLLSCQSETMPGVTVLWQFTQTWAEAKEAAQRRTLRHAIIRVSMEHLAIRSP